MILQVAIPILLTGVNPCCIIWNMENPWNYKDLTGIRFGRLIVTQRAPDGRWNCICDCGRKVPSIPTGHLNSKHTRSCGCLIADTRRERSLKHGLTGSPEWRSWIGAKRRSANPAKLDKPHYADVKMHPEWEHDFQAFLNYVGPRPSADHSLDRWPNMRGNYEPGNVRWATRREQAQNTRKTKFWTLDGITKAQAQWARELGFPHSTQILRRVQTGWSLRDALTLPAGSENPARKKV